MSDQAVPITSVARFASFNCNSTPDPGACAPAFMLSPAPQVVLRIRARFGRVVGFFLVVIDSTSQVLLHFNGLLRRGIEHLLQSHRRTAQYPRTFLPALLKFFLSLHAVRFAELIQAEQRGNNNQRN